MRNDRNGAAAANQWGSGIGRGWVVVIDRGILMLPAGEKTESGKEGLQWRAGV